MPRQPLAASRSLALKPVSTFGPQAAWIGLTACLMIAGASGAEAAARPFSRDPACTASAAPCRKAPQPARTPAAPAADPSAGSVVRLVLTTDRSAPRIVQGAPAGAGRHNPYTLVGNRIGLESAARVERRDGEIWLVPAPARATGLAAFQDGASSVASR